MTYCLKAEDLSHLGGPMGTEYTTTMYRKYFSTEEKAKAKAEKHYGEPIKWRKLTPGDGEGVGITSGDLRWVMYTITKVKVES